MKQTRRNSGTCGFGTLLGLVFIVLKLTDKIDWSWWWVTSPIWIEALLAIVLVGVMILFGVKASIFKK